MNKSSSPRDYSFIAPVYDRVFNRPLAEGHRTLANLIRVKSRKSGLKVLEVGVGSGLTLEYIPKNIHYTGIDINEKMLSLAQMKVQKQRRKFVSLAVMDAHKMTIKDNSYDVVIASSAITAMDAPMKGFREMVRVTKKGGHIAMVANLRQRKSIRSEIVKFFDPFTRRCLGFRTDLDFDSFRRMKDVKLIEHRQVNSLMGMPLSSYLLFEKK